MTVLEKNYAWAYALTPRSLTTHLILHHAAAVNATADGIHAYHLSLGWAGLAYHYFITKKGEVLRGRPENMRGGHTSGFNHCSIGICFEGNFELEEMGQAQIKAGAELVSNIISRFPSISVGAHRDYGATACPGANFPIGLITGGVKDEIAKKVEEKMEPDDWAASAASWACQTGLIIGDENGNINWHNPISRQELALILMRYNASI